MLSALVVAFIAGGCNSSTNTPEADKSSPTSSPVAAETKTAKSSKIDINTAPIAELDKLELPGTKPSLSERIQAGRPYKQNDDLVTKKAISAEEFKLIQNLVTTETKK
ncbi:MAG: DNA uptake protein [Pseudanabaena frigida]|uniref:DNA uptake protein n=1 Tax=Pseudanabaena frigida TaxID=945775 RepID=A0A2W4W7D8_9CYAN|nr:MAG: DNA uptake protein [Pseudanabaena frigida]